MWFTPQTSEQRWASWGLRLEVFRSLFRMLSRSRRWWLAPLLLILVIFGMALAGLQAVEYVSPFIYAVL